LLSQQQSLVLFGEGNHNDQWFLRPLQKGFARIAIAAEEKNNWKLGVNIVPIGIQYESHTVFRSRVLVSFGDAINVKEYFNHEGNAQENFEQLVQQTSEGIKKLILHIDPDNYETKFNFWRSHRQWKQDLIEQVEADQKVVDDYPTVPTLLSQVTEPTQSRWNPIRIYESINHFLPRFLLRSIIKNKVKDPQFTGSIKFTLGMFIVPLFYLIQSGLCLVLTQSWVIALTYFVSLPACVSLRR
jgi:1-acyl-sn-glycerol-3-phosphate acyltransferase